MWLRDFLPEDIEDCRIFLYGYDSNFLSDIDRDHPKHDLAAQAKTLLSSLRKVRSGEVGIHFYLVTRAAVGI